MFGTAGNFNALQQIASATGGQAYDITNPTQISKVFFSAIARRLCVPGLWAWPATCSTAGRAPSQNFLRLYDNPPGGRRVFFVRPDESGASGLDGASPAGSARREFSPGH